jgi:hypothetical protein
VSDARGAVDGDTTSVEHQGSLRTVSGATGLRDDIGPFGHDGPAQGVSGREAGGSSVAISTTSSRLCISET